MDGHARLFRRALDDDLRHAGLLQPVMQILAQPQILVEQRTVVLVGKPAGIPGPVDADAQADRIDLLTHYFVSSRSRTIKVILLNGFSMRPARPRARAWKRFITKLRPTVASAT